MKAHIKKKIDRLNWAKLMKSGKVNDAASGQWTSGSGTTGQHNRAGASHNR